MTSSELRNALIELEAARRQGLELRSLSGLTVEGINVIHGNFWTRSEDGVYYHITAIRLLEWLDALQEWRESSPKATPEQQAQLAAETENPFEPIMHRIDLLEERLTKLEDLINRKLAESMTARHGSRIQALEEFMQEKFKDFE